MGVILSCIQRSDATVRGSVQLLGGEIHLSNKMILGLTITTHTECWYYYLHASHDASPSGIVLGGKYKTVIIGGRSAYSGRNTVRTMAKRVRIWSSRVGDQCTQKVEL